MESIRETFQEILRKFYFSKYAEFQNTTVYLLEAAVQRCS